MLPIPVRRTTLVLAAAALVLLLAWAALTVIGTEPYDNEGYRVALVSTMAVVVVALALALGLAARRAARGRTTAEQRVAAERERAQEAEERAEHAQQESEQRAAETDRADRARDRERHWAQELRREVATLHEARTALAPRDDLRSLVLRVALDLTDAPKGLLLVRPRRGSGPLEVAVTEGFEEDTRRSEIVQRFAELAMEQDQVLREDAPPRSDAPVDEEISTLIAIPMFVADELTGVVICADRPGGFDECDDEVLLALGDNARAALKNTELHGELRDAFVGTVQMLAEAVQAKDPFLRGHSEDVADYVTAISHELGLEDDERELLNFASLLHDVGKIGISEQILLKPGRLTPEERSVIELHPRIGYRLVEQVPGMAEIAPLVLHHHERWDGAGYPAGLRGEEIPLGARVIGVADAFSAMTEQRPYRDRMSLEDACAELERCSGAQFDPRVVGLFCSEARQRPRPQIVGPVAAALADAELVARRERGEGVIGASTAALTDSLTLLYSHRYFHEAASAQASRAEQQGIGFGVVVVRAVGLGAVNAARGYGKGDEVLRECARAFSQVAVRHGAVACRVGGSRLGLLAEGLDEEATTRLAAELRAALTPVLAVQVGAAAWRPGLTGEAVIAAAGLAQGTLAA